ncbi:hypothetical protein CDD83_10057 [Cordyceps sp. RAO-2017]|nr:hypothetical protein CDD83_10057 [Cordyceps sp. RAO-2017]
MPCAAEGGRGQGHVSERAGTERSTARPWDSRALRTLSLFTALQRQVTEAPPLASSTAARGRANQIRSADAPRPFAHHGQESKALTWAREAVGCWWHSPRAPVTGLACTSAPRTAAGGGGDEEE